LIFNSNGKGILISIQYPYITKVFPLLPLRIEPDPRPLHGLKFYVKLTAFYVPLKGDRMVTCRIKGVSPNVLILKTGLIRYIQ